jgi:hypothetical protein
MDRQASGPVVLENTARLGGKLREYWHLAARSPSALNAFAAKPGVMMSNRIPCICVLASVLLLGTCPAVSQSPQPQALQNLKEDLKARSEQFQARVDEAAREVESDPRLVRLTHQQQRT